MISRTRSCLTAAAALIAAALSCGPAAAQSPAPPYVHGGTVSTSPIQAAPASPVRRKIVLYNPNATALIAFCPAGPNRDTGVAFTCAVNGAGSITLQPYTGLVLQGALPNGVPLTMSAAWNVVANGGGSAYTFLDFE